MNNSTFLVWSVKVTEFLVDLIKSAFSIAGVTAAALADVIMGAIGISLLFGGLDNEFFGYKTSVLGGAISLAAGAFQIYMWVVLKKRGIGILEALVFWKLPKDIRAFVGCTLAILLIDTSIDTSPISLLVIGSAYKQIPILHETMVILVSIMVVIICGFSEILTSNLSEILLGGKDAQARGQKPATKNIYTPKFKPQFGPQFEPQQQYHKPAKPTPRSEPLKNFWETRQKPQHSAVPWNFPIPLPEESEEEG